MKPASWLVAFLIFGTGSPSALSSTTTPESDFLPAAFASSTRWCGQSLLPTTPTGAISNSIAFRNAFLQRISEDNILALRSHLVSLSATEQRFLQRQLRTPQAVVTRFSNNVCEIFKANGTVTLLSPRAINPAAPRGGTTPLVEDRLFQAYSCVFSTVGPKQGDLRYGSHSVSLDLSSPTLIAWANLGSGARFVKKRRMAACEAQLAGETPAGGENFRSLFASGAFERLLLQLADHMAALDRGEPPPAVDINPQSLAYLVQNKHKIFRIDPVTNLVNRDPSAYPNAERCKIQVEATLAEFVPSQDDVEAFRQNVFAPKHWKEAQGLQFLKQVREKSAAPEGFLFPSCPSATLPEECMDTVSPFEPGKDMVACRTPEAALSYFLSVPAIPEDSWHTCLHQTDLWTLESKADERVTIDGLAPDADAGDIVARGPDGRPQLTAGYQCTP